MEEFIKRIIEEKKELDEKILKLEAFIMSDKFSSINERQRNLLQKQVLLMVSYSDVLKFRIDDLTSEVDNEFVNTENPGIDFIFGSSYILLDFSEALHFIEEEWFEEEVESIEDIHGVTSYFVPVTRYFKFLNTDE